MKVDELRDALARLLTPGQVSREAEVLEEHARDRWHASHAPDVVVFAETRGDVEKLLAFAHERRIPVTPRGAGVGYVGGCVPVQAGIVLSLARMNRIREIHPVDGVAVVEPGVITGDLQDAVRKLGWYYPPDPASLRECSLGGNVATNAGGPKCLKYGVTRNYVLGLEVVLADGRVLRTGSRTHKNKTGLDLVGLFVGSEGLLGVVTEITLRIIPLPPARATFSVGFGSFEEAAGAVQRIFGEGYLPCAMEISDILTLQAARKYAEDPAMVPPGNAHLIVEIDGQPGAVAADEATLRRLLESLKPTHLEVARDEESCEAIWEIRRSFSYSLRATGLVKMNHDIVVPRSRLVDLARFAQQLREETGYQVAAFGHAGDGNIHVNLMVEPEEMEQHRERVEAALDRMFQQVLAWDGVITGEHGVGIARLPWMRQAVGDVSVSVHRALKDALDPRGILNPGKVLPG